MKFGSILFLLAVNTAIFFLPSFTYEPNEINAHLKLQSYLYPQISQRHVQYGNDRRLSRIKSNKTENLKKKSKYSGRDLKQLKEEDQLNLDDLFDHSDDKELNDERLLNELEDIRILGEEDTNGRFLSEDYADQYGR